MIFDYCLNGDQLGISYDQRRGVISTSGNTDYYLSPLDGSLKNNAPLYLRKWDLNTPFTLQLRMRPNFFERYDAGMLFIYVKEDIWIKFAFTTDGQLKRRLETVVTNGFSDGCYHRRVKEPSVLLKISSNGKSMGFYAQDTSGQWEQLRLISTDFFKTNDISIGFGSQSPRGTGNKTCISEYSLVEKAVEDFTKGI